VEWLLHSKKSFQLYWWSPQSYVRMKPLR
jgi:hypothetical protein